MRSNPIKTSLPDNIRDIVIHHDTQITTLSTRINEVEIKIDDIGSKIDTLVQTVATKQSFDFSAMLSHIRDISILIGLSVSAIIWVASSYTSAELAVMKEKDKRFEAVYERNIIRMDLLDKKLTDIEIKKEK